MATIQQRIALFLRNTAFREDDKFFDIKCRFIAYISIISAVLIFPAVIFYFVKWELISLLMNIGIEVLLIVNYILIRRKNLKWVNYLTYAFIYNFLAFGHVYLGANFSNLLSVVTVFLVLSYTAYNQRFKVLNAVTAVLFLGIMMFFLDREMNDQELAPFFDFFFGGILNMTFIVFTVLYFEFQFQKASEAISAKNQLLEQISHLNPFLMWTVNNSGTFTYANQTLLDTIGMNLSTFVATPSSGSPIRTLMLDHKEKHGNHEEAENRVVNRIAKLLDVTGNERWYECSTTIIRTENNAIEGTMYTAVEISEQYKSELERKRSIALLQSTLSSVSSGILVVNEEQEIILHNKQFCQIWQIDEISLKSMNLQQLFSKMRQDVKQKISFSSWVDSLLQDAKKQDSLLLYLANGKILDISSRPQYLAEDNVGRIWNISDVTKIKSGELALIESESRYRDLFNEHPVGIVIVDLFIENRGLRCNTTAMAMFEATEDELLSGNFLSHSTEYQPGGRSSIDAYIEVLNDYRAFKLQKQFIWQFKKQSGEPFLADVTFSPIIAETEELTMITIADITDLIGAQQALTKSEEKYRTLVEELPNGIIQSDENGLINFASQRALIILGKTHIQDLVGKNLFDVIPAMASDDKPKHRLSLRKWRSNEFVRYPFLKASGEEINIEIGGKFLVGDEEDKGVLIGILRDVSDFVRNEQKLIKSEERHRLLFEMNFDGFLVLNDEGEIEDINQSLIDLMQFPEIQKIRGNHLDFVIPELAIRPEFNQIQDKRIDQIAPFSIECTDYFGEPLFLEIFFSQIVIDGTQKIACAIKNIVDKKLLADKEIVIQSKQAELETLNRELISNSLFSNKKNKLLEEIRKEIITISRKSSGSQRKTLIKLAHNIDLNLDEHEQMLSFRLQFEKIHPDFFKRVIEKNPKLTNNELKLAAFIKLNMSMNEISQILHVEKKSIEMAKYRMKKKLGLDKSKNLNEFILKL